MIRAPAAQAYSPGGGAALASAHGHSTENDMTQPDRIDVKDEQALQQWAKKLDATPEQLREAVQAVGDRAADVEMHLKGVRSTTNEDRVHEAGS
jgi:hypothetical protein